MRYKVFVVVLFVVVVVGGYIYYSRYSTGLTKVKILEMEKTLGLVKTSESFETVPAELGDGFSPTKNQAGFEIMSVDPDGKTKLKYMYPDHLRGTIVNSKISCSDGDYYLIEGGGADQRKVSEEFFWQKINESADDTNILYATCNNDTCEVIDRKCSLYIPGDNK